MNEKSLKEVFLAYKDGKIDGLRDLSEVARVTEFSSFLARGLKTLLIDQYKTYMGPVDWEFAAMQSDGAFETYPKIGGPDMIDERMAGGEFVRVGFNSEDVTLVNAEYGGIMEIDRYLLLTDQTRKIQAMPQKMGEAAARKKHSLAFGIFNNGLTDTCYDAAFVFAVIGAGHPNVTGGAANANNTNQLALGALTEANWEALINVVADWQGIYGETLQVNITGIITGQTDRFTAQRLFKDPIRVPIAATTYGHEKNIFNGTADVQFDNMLTAASWYAKTDVVGFVNQTLQPLDVAEEPENAGLSFDAFMRRYRVYEAYKLGVIDWRNYCKGN